MARVIDPRFYDTDDAWSYEREEARSAQLDAYDDRPTVWEVLTSEGVGDD